MPLFARNYREKIRLSLLLVCGSLLSGAGGCVAGRAGMAPTTPTAPARPPITFDLLHDRGWINTDGDFARGLRWRPDGEHYEQHLRGGMQIVEALSGTSQPAYDHQACATALAELEGVEEWGARAMARRPGALAGDYSFAIAEHAGQLYLYRFDTGEVRQLTESARPRKHICLSPTETHLAYVIDNDLYAFNLESGNETRLTHDGGETLLNGVLDWVYQEEVYGRGHWRAFWWSEDSAHVAFLQLDESAVPESIVVDSLHVHPRITTMRYPKAGDPNPAVRLGITTPEGGDVTWADLAQYADAELLIVAVGWSPAGRLVACVQDREQRWLDLVDVDPDSGTMHVLIHETSPAWVTSRGLPHWLDDGTFLWRSARDEYVHLYHYAADGTLLRRVTEGPWDVRRVHGVDDAERVYFTGTADTTTENHVYRVPLAPLRGGSAVSADLPTTAKSGSAGETPAPLGARTPERLTEPGFTHRVNFNPQMSRFVDTFSNITTVPRVHLCNADGELVRVISANESPEIAGYELQQPELVRVPTAAGYELNATVLRPPARLGTGPWPVLVRVYGAPEMPIVHNRWGGYDILLDQALAQEGILVWTVDPHCAGGQGAASAWQAYQKLGVTEVADLEESLRWLGTHEPVDLGRVAIYGESYGGYLAAFALTHSEMFAAGIAALTVTDWQNYDSIYTERYMRTPANNPSGYQQASVLEAAHQLHGRLLIAHGVQDDNVHIANAYQLIQRLQQAEQSFDLMIYPADGHGLYNNNGHWPRLRRRFLCEQLGVRVEPAATDKQ